MTDIAINFDMENGLFDALLLGNDLQKDDGLETAIYISLFTNARANDDDLTPNQERGGWWGDAFSPVKDDKIGSRLWLLHPGKLNNEIAKKARDYALEALNWLIADGVAKQIEIEFERQPPSTVAIKVILTKPEGIIHKFDYIWKAV